MPSITYWNRLEPTSRANDLVPPLAARVHDALWFLARQWQFGEFRGEDSGSAAWIEVDTTSTRMLAMLTPNQQLPIDARVPLEKLMSAALPIDLATSIDLGQTFEWMLADATLVAPFRAAYPIAAANAADKDAESIRLRTLMSGRALDGAALFNAVAATLPNLPPQPAVPLAKQAAVRTALQKWVAHVRELFGDKPGAASTAWNELRFAYEFDVSVGGSGGYAVRPNDQAEATWECFSGRTLPVNVATTEQPEKTKITRLPASIRFRGMPARRYWEFDDSTLDFGAVEIERRDVAKLVLTDLLMLQGDQWFIVPVEQKAGTILSVDTVLVRDVFGLLTLIPPAATATWSAFRTGGTAPLKGTMFPATATASVQYGAAIDETRFARDEMMNMVWAIRGAAASSASAAAPPAIPRYVLRPAPPPQWTPYVPKSSPGGVQYERADSSTSPARLAEEEVRRSGVRIQRFVARSRGFLGHTYLWIASRRSTSPAETTSVPRFDALIIDES